MLTPAQRTEYIRLRESGLTHEDAVAKVRQLPRVSADATAVRRPEPTTVAERLRVPSARDVITGSKPPVIPGLPVSEPPPKPQKPATPAWSNPEEALAVGLESARRLVRQGAGGVAQFGTQVAGDVAGLGAMITPGLGLDRAAALRRSIHKGGEKVADLIGGGPPETGVDVAARMAGPLVLGKRLAKPRLPETFAEPAAALADTRGVSIPLLNREGKTAPAMLAGGTVGGVSGAAAGAQIGDTPEERLRNSLIGASVGIPGGMLAGQALTRGRAGAAPKSPRSSERGTIGVEPEIDALGGRKPPVPPQAVGTATAGPSPDEFINVAKFGLTDPSAEQRLRGVVKEVVTASGLDPKRRVSWDETKAMARELGLDPAGLARGDVKRLTGPELLGIRNIVRENIATLEKLSKDIQPIQGTPQAADLAQIMDVLEQQNRSLLDRFIRSRTEAGRTLNNLKIVAEHTMDPVFWQAKARQLAGNRYTADVIQQVDKLIQGGDRQALTAYVAKLAPKSKFDKAFTFYQLNLLAAPKTHAINVTSNVAMAAGEQGSKAVGAGVDRLLAHFTGKRSLAGPSAQEVGAGLEGAVQGLRRAPQILRNPAQQQAGLSEMLRQVHYDTPALEDYRRTIYGLLGAEDAVFYDAALKGSVVNRARVQAMNDGLKGTAMIERANQLAANPSPDLFAGAMADAAQTTFKDKTQIGQFLGSLRNLIPGGRYVIPFKQTPGALATRALEYSPFGLAKGIRDAIKVAAKGPEAEQALQREAAMLVGRGATGSSVIGLGAWLRSKGLASPVIPRGERGERETAQLAGESQGSLVIGGKMYDLRRLDPIGPLLGLGATLYDVWQNPEWRAAGDVAGHLLGTMGSRVADQPMIQGMRQVVSGVERPETMARVAEGVPAGFVPASAGLASVARMVDPIIRETDQGGPVKRAVNRVVSRLPGLSKALPPALNQFGEPAERTTGVAGELSPVPAATPRTDDPVIGELRRLGVTISRRRTSQGKGPERVRATVELEGPEIRKALSDAINSPDYQQWSDALKRETLQRIVSGIRTAMTTQEKADYYMRLREMGKSHDEAVAIVQGKPR